MNTEEKITTAKEVPAQEIHRLSPELAQALTKNVDSVLEFYDAHPQVEKIQVLSRNNDFRTLTEIKKDPNKNYLREAVTNALLHCDNLKRVPFIFILADDPTVMAVDASVDMRVPNELNYRTGIGPDYYKRTPYLKIIDELTEEGKL